MLIQSVSLNALCQYFINRRDNHANSSVKLHRAQWCSLLQDKNTDHAERSVEKCYRYYYWIVHWALILLLLKPIYLLKNTSSFISWLYFSSFLHLPVQLFCIYLSIISRSISVCLYCMLPYHYHTIKCAKKRFNMSQ